MPQRTFEELKAEIELERLDIEKRRQENERRRNYHEGWKNHVHPIEKTAEEATKHSVSFAQSAIRSVFILNGGGLVAFPTFANLIGPSILRDALTFSVATIAFYTAGLVFAAAASLSGYLNFQLLEAVRYVLRDFVAGNLNNAEIGKPVVEWDEYEDKIRHDRLWKSARRTALIGVIVGCAGAVAFVAGTFLALLVLSGHRG